MYIKMENGLRVLYPDNEKNVLRSRLTNDKFHYVFLSRDDSEENYTEETLECDTGMESVLVLLENARNKKLSDLNARYELLKTKIKKANTTEEINSINIF